MPQIEEIIRSIKIDIKRQPSAVRNSSGNDCHKKTNTADTMNVVTYIETRFKDLVGCDSEISYMKSIIDMLVNKGIYKKNT